MSIGAGTRRRMRRLLLGAAAGLVVAAVAPATGRAEGGVVVGWGENEHHELGTTWNSNFESNPVSAIGPSTGTAVAAGNWFGLALMANHTVQAWGSDFLGQLGIEPREGKDTPNEVPGLTEAAAVAASGEHSMALLKNGTVMTWGEDFWGELGNGKGGTEKEREEIAKREEEEKHEKVEPERQNTPKQVKTLENVAAIASGGPADFALLTNGEVMAWGGDEDKMLGLGSAFTPETCIGEAHLEKPCSTVPRRVALPEGVKAKAIAAGWHSAFAVTTTGHVFAWGDNGKGELGLGKEGKLENYVTPVEIPGLEHVTAISSGESHTLALLEDHEVMAFGANQQGQLSGESTEKCGSVVCERAPKTVSGLSEVMAVAAGKNFSVALKEIEGSSTTGKVYTWGTNEDYGQLGRGGASGFSSTPTEVEGLSPVTSIASGTNFSLGTYESGYAGFEPLFTVTPESKGIKIAWTVPCVSKTVCRAGLKPPGEPWKYHNLEAGIHTYEFTGLTPGVEYNVDYENGEVPRGGEGVPLP